MIKFTYMIHNYIHIHKKTNTYLLIYICTDESYYTLYVQCFGINFKTFIIYEYPNRDHIESNNVHYNLKYFHYLKIRKNLI